MILDDEAIATARRVAHAALATLIGDREETDRIQGRAIYLAWALLIVLAELEACRRELAQYRAHDLSRP